jgi:hypothetical protein
MKQILLTLTAVLAAGAAFAQGQVNFSTRVPGTVVAPVTVEGSGALIGSAWYGQLYAAAVGSTTFTAVGTPVAFRDDASGNPFGFIIGGGTVTLPTGFPGGTPAQFELKAWAKSQGATFEAAQAAGQGGFGQSAAFTVTPGNPAATPVPDLPANLAGLQSFTVTPVIPEPAVAALGLLGAGLLLIRRKK